MLTRGIRFRGTHYHLINFYLRVDKSNGSASARNDKMYITQLK